MMLTPRQQSLSTDPIAEKGGKVLSTLELSSISDLYHRGKLKPAGRKAANNHVD